MFYKGFELLKTYYTIRIGIGLISAFFGSFIAGILGITTSNNEILAFLMNGFAGFFILLFTMVLIPSLALQELNKFDVNHKLIFNYIDAFLMLFSFFPVAILQFYMLNKIKKEDTFKSDTEDESSDSMIGIYILLIFAVIIMLPHILDAIKN